MFNSLALANSKIGQLTIKLARLENRMGLGGVIGVPTGHIEMATPKTLSTPISTNIHIDTNVRHILLNHSQDMVHVVRQNTGPD